MVLCWGSGTEVRISIAPAFFHCCESLIVLQGSLRRRSAASPCNAGRPWATRIASSPASKTTGLNLLTVVNGRPSHAALVVRAAGSSRSCMSAPVERSRRPRRIDTHGWAATWDGSFPAKQTASGPLLVEPATSEAPTPTAHVMPEWEPSAEAARGAAANEPTAARHRPMAGGRLASIRPRSRQLPKPTLPPLVSGPLHRAVTQGGRARRSPRRRARGAWQIRSTPLTMARTGCAAAKLSSLHGRSAG